jgi:hypothetical protein
MISNYFYHEILRKTIVSFGTLFNNIEIKHKDSEGDTFSIIKVPVSYGPVQKFLARLEQVPDLKKRVAITLPRMSFEMTGISYDSSRKVSTLQTFKSVNKDTNKLVKNYMPVPYNVNFELSIMSKLNEDALQIVEQILPYFQPQFTLSVDLVEELGEKKDIPIVFNSINMDDQYEGDFTTRRILLYTLNFTAKTYLFGPTTTSNEGLIRKVQVDYYSDTNRNKNSSRELRYVANVRALKDYNEDQSAVLNQDVNQQITEFEVSDSSPFIVGSYIQIGEESMYIKSINDNKLLVTRGQNSTSISNHSEGDLINIIDESDDDLVEFGDDFGFSEYRYDLSDGKTYSPTKGDDV